MLSVVLLWNSIQPARNVLAEGRSEEGALNDRVVLEGICQPASKADFQWKKARAALVFDLRYNIGVVCTINESVLFVSVLCDLLGFERIREIHLIRK